MKNKILTIILIILLVLLGGVSTIYIIFNNDKDVTKDKKESDYVIIESNELGKDREFLGLNFSDVKVESNGKRSKYSVTITNNTDKDIQLGKYNIIFKDKNDNVVGIFVGYVDGVIKVGDVVSPTIEADIDLSDAYTLQYQEYIDGELVDQQDKNNNSNVTSDVEEW